MIALAIGLALVLQEPHFAPDLADWNARDLEGRWIVLERETAANGWSNVVPLIAFLEDRREAELLEWLCLYARSEGQLALFAAALERLDAPQWARALEWALQETDSHSFDSAAAALMRRAEQVAGWTRAHESELHVPREKILARLGLAPDADPPAPSGWFAPWKTEEVLAHLAPELRVHDFGERLRAELGVAYLHQIERELRAVAHVGLYAEPWLARVHGLTRHERPEVRSMAWIALGEAKRGRIAASALATSEMLAVADDVREDLRVREAALMAASQRAEWDPGAWLALHDVALAPEHAAWKVALDRLGDVGDEFTLERLKELEPSVRSDALRRDALRASIEALRERANDGGIASKDVVRALERTAWVDCTCGTLEAGRKEWTRTYFAERRASPEVAKVLAATRSRYAAPEDLAATLQTSGASFGDFPARVREWAGVAAGD